MNLVKKITTGALALALSIGLAGGAVAQDADGNPLTGDVSVEITSAGVLSVAITDHDFLAYEYALVEQNANAGVITISPSDERGTAAGWSVTLAGTDFVATTFTVDNLALSNGVVATTSTTLHPTEAQPLVTDPDAVSTSAETVITAAAGTGAGTYDVDFDAALTIPAGTLVGTYNSTLTVTITGADVIAPPAP